MVSIADRLKSERESRRWQPQDLIDAMKATGFEPSATDENLARSIRRWESGEREPDARHQIALAAAFDLAVATLFAPNPDRPSAPPSEIDETEIIERIRRTDLDSAVLDDLTVTVDRLCTAYSTEPADQVLVDARRWLVEIQGMVRESPGRHAGRLLDQAAWLALLIGCLHNDLGRRDRAEAMRRSAGHLAIDAGNHRARAWSHEMTAWFNLDDGEPRAAIAAARAGQEIASHSDVAVHMAGQEAEGWAKLGEKEKALGALDRARTLLDQVPWIENPRNHFRIDPPKARKAQARVARILGDYEAATRHALAMIDEGRRPDGTYRQPMRVSDAKSVLATIAAEQGDVAEALRLAHEALDIKRISAPSLLLITSEVADLLPQSGEVVELRQRVMVRTRPAEQQ